MLDKFQFVKTDWLNLKFMKKLKGERTEENISKQRKSITKLITENFLKKKKLS